MRVYADVLFALNAAADYALLLAAARLVGLRVPARRLLCGAALGGLYAVAALFVRVPILFSLPGTAAAAAAMGLAAYAPRPPRVFLRLMGCLYGSAALAAGLALSLARGPGAGVPWWGIALALGGTVMAAAALRERWRPGGIQSALCDLEIEIASRSASCRALLDTGNQLSDPCGDGPAVVVHASVLRRLVPAVLLQALAAGPDALVAVDSVALAAAEASVGADGGTGGAGPRESWDFWSRRIRLLPYATVDRGGGLFCGVRPDHVWLRAGRRRRPVRAVLAVSAAPLDPDGAFAALVPAALAGLDPKP